MKRAVSFVTLVSGIVLGCLLLTRISSAQENVKWTTESVLTKVDKSASDFRSLTADIEQIKLDADLALEFGAGESDFGTWAKN